MSDRIVMTELLKRYGQRTVVNAVSAEVRRGEVVGLLGPNGAGKTTTFYMVVGLIRPDGGSVVLERDGNVRELTGYLRRRALTAEFVDSGAFVTAPERSTFERRRVEIARAIATDPAFLLLDEPFTGIDPIAVADIQAMIRQLRDRGLGVLITDHQVRETLAIVDRAYILNDGEIVVSGTAQDVLDSPVARQFYLGAGFRL